MDSLNRFIDHTLLRPDATKEQIEQLCWEAKQYQFAAVCVNPFWVSCCAQLLQGTDVSVATVVGFPLGANTSEVKAYETRQAVKNGASEIDMVLNIGALKSGALSLVQSDVSAVVEAAGESIVKVILETGFLSDEEISSACGICVKAGADFVKTSTGFGPGGATLEHVRLMRKSVGPAFGVKASGGVRDYASAAAMIEAGATRIGTSSGVAILNGQTGGSDY